MISIVIATLRTALLFLLVWITSLPATSQDRTWLTDVTRQVGLDSLRMFRINSVDINGDGYPDLLVDRTGATISTRAKDTRIILNLQHPDSSDSRARLFRDVTDESGIYASRSGDTSRVIDVAAMADFNNDGHLDLVTAPYYDRLENYRFPNDVAEVLLGDGKGGFQLVTNNGLSELGLFNCSGFTFLDYDLDGNLDIYISVWFLDRTRNQFDFDKLMRGRGDGTFEDMTTSAGIDAVSFPMYGASSTDWNNDGWPDILTSAYCRSGGSLWKNNGDGTFTDVAAEVGYTSQASTGDVDGSGPRALCQWAALPADYDNDGDMDIAQVLVHGGLDAGEGRSTISVNSGASNGYKLRWNLDLLPRDTPRSSHLGDQDGSWLDINNDGWQDFTIAQCVYVPSNDRSYIWLNNPMTGRFSDITGELGLVTTLRETHNSRPLDYDQDGDDDLLTELWRAGNRPNLQRNDVGNRFNHLKVVLEGDKAAGVNMNAIGARVIVHVGGASRMREVQAGMGHFGSQQPFERIFGLGPNTVVDSLVVLWPNATKTRTVLRNVAANQTVRLKPTTASVSEYAPRSLQVIPHPSFESAIVSGLSNDGPAQCSIYTVGGVELARKSVVVDNASIQLDLRDLLPGIYLVRVGAQATYVVKAP